MPKDKNKSPSGSGRRSQEGFGNESVRWTREHHDPNDDDVSTSSQHPVGEHNQKPRRTVVALMKENLQPPSSIHDHGSSTRRSRRNSPATNDEEKHHELGPGDGPTLVTHLPDIVVNHNHRLPLPNQFRVQVIACSE